MKKRQRSNKRIKQSNIGRSYIKLSQDLMFKIYFTKNKKLLLSLLKAFLPLPSSQKIERIDILNPQTIPETKEKKQIILDLKLRLNNEEKINVEMQVSQKKDFLSRVLFYWAKLYTEDLKVSEPYEKAPPTYSLIFTNFQVFKETKDFVTCFSLCSDQAPHFCLNRDLKIVFVELSKFKKTSIKGLIDLQDYWCYILKHSGEIKPDELEKLSQKGEDMKEAVVHLKRLSRDEKLRMEEEARLKFISDQKAEKAWVREEGIKEGMQKGKKEALRKIALKMLEENMDFSIIEKITGISASEIQNLQKRK